MFTVLVNIFAVIGVLFVAGILFCLLRSDFDESDVMQEVIEECDVHHWVVASVDVCEGGCLLHVFACDATDHNRWYSDIATIFFVATSHPHYGTVHYAQECDVLWMNYRGGETYNGTDPGIDDFTAYTSIIKVT